MLDAILTLSENRKNRKKLGAEDKFDEKAHHLLARKAAAESAVLLKNSEQILPLKPETRVALIGDFTLKILGVEFTWSLLGYEVLRDASGAVSIGGGLRYFISYETGSFLAQCINFPLQRYITFKSHGNPVYQAIWYFIAWIVISLICNGLNNLWMPVAAAYVSPAAAAYVSPAVYNILVTFITGGVSMIIFFFVFKIIFPEGEQK